MPINWRPSLVELVAAVAVCGAVLLVGRQAPAGFRWRPAPRVQVASGAAAVALAVVLSPSRGLLIANAGAAALGVLWLSARRARRLAQRRTAQAVQVMCAELADDLRMGQLPADAIAAASARWPPLQPVSVAIELHHDIATAWRDVARVHGADGLRDVAAAWSVSEQVGSGLAESLHQVSRLLAARERRARLIDTELAAARATAFVVSGLPVVVLGMGSGLGVNPWSFLLGGLGSILLAAASALLLAGWAWLDWLTARAMS